jgi:phosphohistidine phosphatase SixA
MAKWSEEKMSHLIISDVVEHEDGSATYSFDMSDDAARHLAEIGLEFVLHCAVAEINMKVALDLILHSR